MKMLNDDDYTIFVSYLHEKQFNDISQDLNGPVCVSSLKETHEKSCYNKP